MCSHEASGHWRTPTAQKTSGELKAPIEAYLEAIGAYWGIQGTVGSPLERAPMNPMRKEPDLAERLTVGVAMGLAVTNTGGRLARRALAPKAP